MRPITEDEAGGQVMGWEGREKGDAPACATIWQRYRKQAESRKRLRVAVGEIRKVIASQAAARNVCHCDTCTGERIARGVFGEKRF